MLGLKLVLPETPDFRRLVVLPEQAVMAVPGPATLERHR